MNGGITSKILPGTNGAAYPSGSKLSGPMPQSLTQTYGVRWQIPICQINVTQGLSMVTNVNLIDQRKFVATGGAQAYAVIVAMPNASPKMRQNADFQIPTTAGYADAEEIINEAFDALPLCGGTVMLSEGDCVIDSSITPPSGTIFAGCGDQTTITMGIGADDVPMVDIGASTDIVVHDMLLNGGGAGYTLGTGNTNVWPSPTGQHGIHATGGNVLVYDMTITGAKGGGIFFEEPAGYNSNQIIRNSLIELCYACGIAFSGNYGFIKDNQISTVGGEGLYVSAPAGSHCDANKVAGNIITGSAGDGLKLVGNTAGCNMLYNMLTNNEIAQCGLQANSLYSGISLWGASGATHDHTTLIGNVVWTAAAPNTLYGLLINSSTVTSTRAIANDFLDSGTGANIQLEGGATYSGVGLNLI